MLQFLIKSILKDNKEGIEFELTQGQWMTAENGRGGERDIAAAVNIGMPLTDNGFLNVSAEYAVRPELSRGYQHKDASDGYKGWVKADDNKDATTGTYSGTQNVAPSALVPMLVKAVQELSAEVEELKKGK